LAIASPVGALAPKCDAHHIFRHGKPLRVLPKEGPMPMHVRAATLRFGDPQPAYGRGWTQREVRAINRVRAACEKYPHLEMVAGESDEGDPWWILCDREGERILLHIARIDRCYVIAWPCRCRLRRIASIVAATDLALSGLDRELHEHFRSGHTAA
jgi:hypothetical protein